jgi:hypothetical protein
MKIEVLEVIEEPTGGATCVLELDAEALERLTSIGFNTLLKGFLDELTKEQQDENDD